MTKFTDLGLCAPILAAIEKQGYTTPTPIQAQAIPPVLAGRDVMAAAQTGTGKTAGFTLPILERLKDGRGAGANQARVLILTPTRELAAQILESVETYGGDLKLRSAVVFGGVKINPQMMKLRSGVDILVATPGRLLDLYQQRAVKFEQLEVLVLDEADRMLDMGFIHDIRKILAVLPAHRQTLMFSATFSEEIRKLAKGLVKDPVEVSVTPRNTTTELVSQRLCSVDKKAKPALLVELIRKGDWGQTLVFTKTKHGANKLTKYLESEGIVAAAIHGNKSQGARTKALAEFKANKCRVLVATDIAARGLDIDQLPHVVNFDLPNVPEDYVHRIGRTGRAGASGEAVSLVSHDEVGLLSDIERLIGQLIDREVVDGFEPEHNLPETFLHRAVRGPKQAPSQNRGRNRTGRHSSGNTRSEGRSEISRSERSSGRGHTGGAAAARAGNRASGGAGNSTRDDSRGNRGRQESRYDDRDDNRGNRAGVDTGNVNPYAGRQGRPGNRAGRGGQGRNHAARDDNFGNRADSPRESNGNRAGRGGDGNRAQRPANNQQRRGAGSGQARPGQGQRGRGGRPQGEVNGNR